MSHQLNDYLDGPRFVAWLEERGYRYDLLTETQKRRLWEWRNGGMANIYVVDALLIRLGHFGESWQLEEMAKPKSRT